MPPSSPCRREAARTLGAAVALPSFADAPAVASDGSAFDVVDLAWLTPFKGIDDSDPSRRDLHCDALVVTGHNFTPA